MNLDAIIKALEALPPDQLAAVQTTLNELAARPVLTREALNNEFSELEGLREIEVTPASNARKREICRLLAEAKCRHCGIVYDAYKSRADLQGFCSMQCQHAKARACGAKLVSEEYRCLKAKNALGSDYVVK